MSENTLRDEDKHLDDTVNHHGDETGERQDQENRAIRRQHLKDTFRKGGRNMLFVFIGVGLLAAYSYFSGPDAEKNTTDSSSVISRGGRGEVNEDALPQNSPIKKRQVESEHERQAEALDKGKTQLGKIILENEERKEREQTHTASDAQAKETAAGRAATQSVNRAVKKMVPTITDPSDASSNGHKPAGSTPAGWSLADEISDAEKSAESVKKDLKKIAKNQSDYGTFEEFKSVASASSDDTEANSSGSDRAPFVEGGFGESMNDGPGDNLEATATTTIPADTRLMGVATVGHNSDKTGPMSFEAVSPPLDGAVFIAESVKMSGESVNPKISKMLYRGESYDVQAIIVNAETFQPGIASDVDHHYLSRWVPFLLASFGGAYADTLTNSTVTTTSEGNTVNESSGVPDASDQLKYTVGTGLSKAIPYLEKQIDRPVTVTVVNGQEVGIWILSKIEVSDE